MVIKPLSFHLGIRDACPCQSINAGAEEKMSVLTMPGAHSRRWECERCCEESNGEKRSVGMVKGKGPT